MEAQPVGGALLTAPADAAGETPVASGPRSPLPVLFLALCIGSGMLLHAEQLAAAVAQAQHLSPLVVVSITALFNLVIFSLNLLVARGRAAGAGAPSLLLRPTATSGAAQRGFGISGGAPAPAVSASKSLLSPFLGLCLAMGAALHANPLAAAEYRINPAVVVCVVLAGVALFHLAVLSIHKTLASHRAADEPKRLPRSRRLPLLPFVVLALAVSAASSVETVVMADAAPGLPRDTSVWAALALAVSFNMAIGSLYCFVIHGPPSPIAATVEWSHGHGLSQPVLSFPASPRLV